MNASAAEHAARIMKEGRMGCAKTTASKRCSARSAGLRPLFRTERCTTFQKTANLDYIRRSFHCSIRENYNSKIDDECIPKREQLWMKVLDSKAHGYSN